jgi:hypothetical protein
LLVVIWWCCDGWQGDIPMGEDSELWSEEDIHAVFERVIDRHLDALMPSLSAPEIREAKEAYVQAFDAIFCQLPSSRDYPNVCDSAAALEAAIEKVIEKMMTGEPADPNQILRDWRLLKEMGSLIRHLNDTAENVVSQKLQVASEVREEIEDAGRRLRELARAIHSNCPYLLDPSVELPTSTLRLNAPHWTNRLLRDCQLDCRFILGRTRNMSLRLSRHCRDAGRRDEKCVGKVLPVSPEQEH